MVAAVVLVVVDEDNVDVAVVLLQTERAVAAGIVSPEQCTIHFRRNEPTGRSACANQHSAHERDPEKTGTEDWEENMKQAEKRDPRMKMMKAEMQMKGSMMKTKTQRRRQSMKTR